ATHLEDDRGGVPLGVQLEREPSTGVGERELRFREGGKSLGRMGVDVRYQVVRLTRDHHHRRPLTVLAAVVAAHETVQLRGGELDARGWIPGGGCGPFR